MNVGGATPSCCGPMGGQFIELIDDIIIGRAKKINLIIWNCVESLARCQNKWFCGGNECHP